MNFLSQQEKDEQLITFNETIVNYSLDRSIVELISEQAKIHPTRIAIKGDQMEWTYNDLEKITNQLARCLRDSHGVSESDLVGVKLDNSEWAIASLLGILKAGAAYVPIDPDYPESRRQFILNESNIKLLVTDTNYMFDEEDFDGALFAVDVEFEEDEYSSEPLDIVSNLSSPAYVIYTSGSTGNPKGVVVSHKSLANYLLWAKSEYGSDIDELNFGLFSSLSFDLTVTSIYLPLITGGYIHIFNPQMEISSLLSEYLNSDLNAIKLTPAHVSVARALNVANSNIQRAIVGGDALNSNHIEVLEGLSPNIQIYNEYGPTEATVGCIVKKIQSEKEANVIGKPIGNTQVYILSTKTDIQPLGVTGEICISGDALALGYLNDSEKTAEKFVKHPFKEGELLYKTGDLGKWQPDGNMVFIGRKDFQVKLKGYRIELGEIEESLMKNEKVDNAVVSVAVKEDTEEKELVAYVQAKGEVNREELIEFLKPRIPDYMIPSRFIQLEEFPLTTNGKLDRKALPDPFESEIDSGREYVAPSTENEKALVEVCEDVLKHDAISIKDNFYHLGGDSIKSIQVVARLKQRGLSLKVEHILKHPVLEDLAKFIETSTQSVDQTEVTGDVDLTPVQRWFFESKQIVSHDHFNQSVLLKSTVQLDSEILNSSLKELTRHHDALRMSFEHSENGWKQLNRDASESVFELLFHDLTNTDSLQEQLVKVTEQLQKSISLEHGTLIKVGHFRTKSADFLALIIHHLVVDGVSWRILLEDLSEIYTSLKEGKRPAIPAKTDAYQTWAKKLKNYAESNELATEREYWNGVANTETVVLIDDSSNIPPNDSVETIHLNKARTESLNSSSVHNAYNTELIDILLAALGLAVKKTFSSSKTLIELEGHGREEIIDGVDLTRTVGWFTTMYPFVLDTSNSAEITDILVDTKDALRRIPKKGIGYGILKYLSDGGLAKEANPQIRFNYLGGFDDGKGEESEELFSFADERMANDSPAENGSKVPLDIACIAVNGELTISIRYSTERFDKAVIQSFVESYESSLEHLQETLSLNERRHITASDLTFDGLTFNEIKQLNVNQDLEDVYELSPLQKGIYFHWLTNTSTSLYLEQTSYRIKATDLPIEKLKRAYDLLVERHAVLRTSFTNDYGSTILQVVRKQVKSNFSYTSIKGEPNIDELVEKARREDLKQGFDLASGSQMRLQIIELGSDRYEFIWSHHHILMDGWCISVLVNDFNHLLGLENEELPSLSSVVPYSKYISWLNRQNQENGLKYWKNYLSDFDEVTVLLYKSFSADSKFSGAELTLDVAGEAFNQLDALCAELSITHNSFVQAIWGYLLSRYNNTDDVVFGAVVSGRPAELDGVEDMIGLFSNTVPVRVKVNSDQSGKELLTNVHSHSIDGADFHFLSLADIQSQTENGLDLINHVVLFQNYALQELGEGMLNDDNGLSIESVHSNVESNYDFNLVVSPHDDSLKISFKYNTNVFDESDIQRISGHLDQLIQSFTKDSDKALSSFEYLTESEKEELLKVSGVFEDSRIHEQFRQDQTLNDSFKRVVEKTPGKSALIVEGKELTYRQLDGLSDVLAIELNQRYKVSADDLIGIQLNRNEWAIVAILGVLKAGGAYVPIDPTYPASRKEFMIQDSGIKALITEADFIYDIDYFDGDIFAIDVELDTGAEKKDECNFSVSPNQLAYVMYTSGSTGKPKGVMIEHRSIFNTICAQIEHFELDDSVVGLQFASFSFDASVSETFIVLLSGGTVCLASEKERKDPNLLVDLIDKHQIKLATLPPTYLKSIDVDQISSLNKLISAGEAADLGNAMKFVKNGTFFNAYGPTETAICGTIYTLDKTTQFEGNNLPIGRPISNASVFLMSRDNQLTAKGIVGEICIGGKGVGRGYLNNSELTSKKFIENPFVQGEQMYKTGDLGKWLPDGNLEFIGRKDDQVKVNGFRIELGEIEAALLTNADVKEAVVLTTGSEEDSTQLVAYFVSSADLTSDKILVDLSRKLPSFMLPTRFVQLESFPLTANGKVDKKALSALNESGLDSEAAYQAPESEEEKVLAKVWSDVLKREKIGIKDSFYSLGGDSIKSIQIVARLKQEGYSLKVEQILKTPTIEQLTGFLTRNTLSVDQGLVTGTVELTPIQHWFFNSEEIVNHHHFNQSVLLRSKDRINEIILEKCCHDLFTHHDALRMSFSEQDGVWRQENKEEGVFTIHVHDLRNDENPEHRILDLGQDLQKELNIEEGPLLKLAVFKLKDGDRLGIIVHHLVIDGVSWRIFMEDLFHLYEQYSKNSKSELPPKTSSYKEWASALLSCAQSDELKEEKDYWKALEQYSEEELSLDTSPDVQSVINDAKIFELNAEHTQLLKTQVHVAYQTEINDILLTAFASAVKTTFGNTRIAINLEGHGRENFMDGLDVTRTIGWFTSVYPVVLESSSDLLLDNLVSVKETLRKVPKKGVGYGILKYLTPEGIESTIHPRITFNYLGEFQENENENQRFDFAEESLGDDVSLDNKNSAILDVSGRIEKGKLVMSVRYSKDKFEAEKIEGLKSTFQNNLEQLTESLSSLKQRSLTPSDLTFKHLSPDEVNQLNNENTLVDVYELSPLQSGMYFHWLADNSSEMYVEQTYYKIKASGVAANDLENAYQDLVLRYDILRTCFSQSYGGRLLQIVHDQVPSEFTFIDLKEENSEYEAEKIKVEDLQKGFDLSNGSQMRLTVIQLSENDYEFIWSHHHILMDGWCISLLINDFNALLNARNEGVKANLPVTRPYADYISWISKLDQSKSLDYWKAYLKGYSTVAEVPFSLVETTSDYAEGKSKIQLNPTLVEQIENMCTQLSVTQNTFIQGVWGHLLSLYNANSDVVLGAVVSGRPAALEGVERMVGLFINTIPVRVNSKTEDTPEILLKRLQKEAIETSPFHYMNLSEIQAQSELGNNLINHIILFENYAVQQSDEQSGGLELFVESIETHERTNYDFNLLVSPGDSGLGITAVFNEHKFDKEGIDRVMIHFEKMINEFVEKSSEPLHTLNPLSEEEEQKVLIDFNQTSTTYEADKTLVDLIEEQMLKTPNNVAVCFEDRSLTYRELDELSNQVGHYLKENYQVSPDDTIAIKLPRNEWMIVAMLGCMKSGGAYIPIGVDQPELRISRIVNEAKSKVLLDESELETFMESREQYPLDKPSSQTKADNLAYVIFTSGSSGQPKGVMIEHRNVTNFFKGMSQIFGQEGGVFLAMTNYTFDISVLELLWTLSNGYKVVIQREVKQVNNDDAFSVGEQIVNHKVTHIQMTPSLGAILDQQLSEGNEWKSLKTILLGGEPLPAQLVQSISNKLPEAELYNMYGPTETTIWSTVKKLEKEPERVEIGSPIANTQIYILDDRLKPTSVGVSGEMYIGGDGVARGYIDETLTKESFIENPFRKGERMYRTGDYGMWLSNGSIDCLGRKDQQIKIRGFRVELGEIEEALRIQENVNEAAVLLHENGNEKTLIAYLTSTEEVNASELRNKLKVLVPEYMLPNQFVRLPELPLNSSGKVDRKVLMELEGTLISSGTEYVPPTNDTEMKLVEIWQELLQQERIGTQDDFFVLGGHSLKATQLIIRIEEQFAVKTDLRSFLENPTIAKLAQDISALEWIKAGEETSEEEGDELII